MNLPPEWVTVLRGQGWDASHWMDIGDPRAPDAVIMSWAVRNGFVVFTHDLDFGALLAVSSDAGPSVFQVRSHSVMPKDLANIVIRELRRHEAALQTGALVTVDEFRSRVRILPIRP